MHKQIMMVVFSALLVAMSACDREGPAERVGEKLDNATEDIADGLEDAGNQLEDACEDIKEGLEADNSNC